MEHRTIYKQNGWYTAFPQLNLMPDGNLAVGVNSSPFTDHYLIGDWKVLVSEDEGSTWHESGDSNISHNWNASGVREKYDRYTETQKDGTLLSVGSVGWKEWPKNRQDEIESVGVLIKDHPGDSSKFVSGWNQLFIQQSEDAGKTWNRREYTIPDVNHTMAFPRPIKLTTGTILIPVGSHKEPSGSQDIPGVRAKRTANNFFVWRSVDSGNTFHLFPAGSPICTQEAAFVELTSGMILCLIRSEPESGYLLEMRSDDDGKTWSWPIESQIWAPHSPPHLLKLRDGRILCSYGFRESPMGIRAVISHDDGLSWDIDNTYTLRDDGGYVGHTQKEKNAPDYLAEFEWKGSSDIGYPQSLELSDGSILTVYYITLDDNITHAACTRWEL